MRSVAAETPPRSNHDDSRCSQAFIAIDTSFCTNTDNGLKANAHLAVS